MISQSQTLITGVYRTGSEFLTYLIDTHPDVMASMYKINLMRFYYGKYGESNNIDISNLIDDLSFRLKRRYGISIDKTKYKKALDNKSYGFIYEYLMVELFLKGSGKTHWAEKNQLEWRNLSKFIDIMPNGKGIHIIRDPRSVFLSFKKNTNSKEIGSVYGAVFNCLDSMSYALNSHIKNKNIHVINYSDLVENPLFELEKIFNFLNVNINKINTKVIEKIINKNINSSFQKSNEKFDKNKTINRWKDELEDNDISFIEQICGKEMEKLGFQKISKKNINIEKFANKKFQNNILLKKTFGNFLETGKGFQKFPSDPLDPKNWSI